MRQVLDTPFDTADLRDAWRLDTRKTTAAMVKFRQQYQAFLQLFGPGGRADNALSAYRAFRRRMNLLRRHDRERFDKWAAGLARIKR